MTRRRQVRPDQDRGASLILAIGFVVMVGLISAGLLALATSGLNNRNSLQVIRNREYAADGAIEQAIAQVRPLTCTAPPNFIVDTLNSVAIRVDWTTACTVVQGGDRTAAGRLSSSDGIVVQQRNVIFAACESTGAACVPANVIIRVSVNFQQTLGGAVSITFVQSWSVNR